MDTPKRYHPLLVTLHWLVAVLVGLELYLGLVVMESERSGRLVLAIHMATGIAILALLVVRFVARIGLRQPAQANADNPLLAWLARLVHYGLYLMLLVITVLGLLMAIRSRQLQSAFVGRGPQYAEAEGEFPPSIARPSQGSRPAPAFEGQEGGSEGQEGSEAGEFPAGALLTGPFLLMGIHKLSAYIILLLVSVHVAATLYHLVRRQNVLPRMWYGAR